MDHWKEELHSAQTRDFGAVLFDHYKCDVRLRVPLIAHFATCVKFGCENLQLHSTFIEYVHGTWFVFMSIELVHEERVTFSYCGWYPCSTDVKCCINVIDELPEIRDACIWHKK